MNLGKRSARQDVLHADLIIPQYLLLSFQYLESLGEDGADGASAHLHRDVLVVCVLAGPITREPRASLSFPRISPRYLSFNQRNYREREVETYPGVVNTDT